MFCALNHGDSAFFSFSHADPRARGVILRSHSITSDFQEESVQLLITCLLLLRKTGTNLPIQTNWAIVMSGLGSAVYILDLPDKRKWRPPRPCWDGELLKSHLEEQLWSQREGRFSHRSSRFISLTQTLLTAAGWGVLVSRLQMMEMMKWLSSEFPCWTCSVYHSFISRGMKWNIILLFLDYKSLLWVADAIIIINTSHWSINHIFGENVFNKIQEEEQTSWKVNHINGTYNKNRQNIWLLHYRIYLHESV